MLALISKQDYNRIIQKQIARAFVEKWHFLADIPCLQHWDHFDVQKLARSFQLKFYERGSIVYDQDDPVDWVYFIHEGEFETRKSNYTSTAKPDRQVVDDIRKLKDPLGPDFLMTKQTFARTRTLHGVNSSTHQRPMTHQFQNLPRNQNCSLFQQYQGKLQSMHLLDKQNGGKLSK